MRTIKTWILAGILIAPAAPALADGLNKCTGKYYSGETGKTVTVSVVELRPELGGQCQCNSDNINFGGDIAEAPTGHVYAGGCKVHYADNRDQKKADTVSVVNFAVGEFIQIEK